MRIAGTPNMSEWIAQGTEVPNDLRPELTDSTLLLDRPTEVRSRLVTDGYVLLRSVVDQDLVLSARKEVFERLAEVDEIEQPVINGIATGRSRRRELHTDLGEFWRSVCYGPLIRRATHGPQMRDIILM